MLPEVYKAKKAEIKDFGEDDLEYVSSFVAVFS